ncbi:hypothetical protein [Fontivita pretiosa]|uniref:hypothetical protein n=1 Tax=Fontivita pretiosa TaxID=2989684 RepID=UPI003D16C3AE
MLVKFTYMGDADLSGQLDATDASLLDNGMVNELSDWINGDFDYSGVIDATDIALFDNAWANQGGPLFAGGEPDNVYSAAAEQLFDEWAEKYEPLSPEELIELHTKLYGSAYADALALVQSGKLR